MSSVSALLVIFTGEDCFNLVFLKVQILLKIVLSNISQFQTALAKFEFSLSFAAGAHILFLHFSVLTCIIKRTLRTLWVSKEIIYFLNYLKKLGLSSHPTDKSILIKSLPAKTIIGTACTGLPLRSYLHHQVIQHKASLNNSPEVLQG